MFDLFQITYILDINLKALYELHPKDKIIY